MIKIDYPAHSFKIKKESNREIIFDELRKVWLKLSPEEWVRQNFVRFLLNKNIPSTLVAIEKQIQVGEMTKRFDILVYNKQHQPWMMVECKSMDVRLDESVLNQVLRYNIAVPVRYMVITNGSYCMAFMKDGNELKAL